MAFAAEGLRPNVRSSAMSAPAVTHAPATLPLPSRAPEVLAPAGDWDCVRAAVENGADAVYFGLDRFNARMRAHNFTTTDLPALMEFLHRRGVRGYVTLNILIFADELAEAEDYVKALVSAGVDAVIVQDVGLCRLIRTLSPDLPIHISTQMTVTSPAGIAFARELGAQLVVLARENTLAEIAQIQEAQAVLAAAPANNSEAPASPPDTVHRPPPLPLEVFVHGALCVAYSGQCLTSEALGGRSANRGECAQACRLPYDLVADGRPVDLGGRRYLLSPQDLAGLDVIPELIRLGVASLKIEGRLKSAEYVANITRVYREAVDRVLAALGEAGNDGRAAVGALQHEHRYAMEMAFSRGFHTGWFRGIDNQRLVHARYGTKRGVLLGTVTRLDRDGVAVRLEAPLKPGDGVVFDHGTPEDGETGGRVYELFPRGAETLLTFGRGDLDATRIHIGDRVWKTNDPELDRRLRASFAGDRPRHLRPVVAEVHGAAGTPLTFLLRDELGHVARAESATPLVPAARQPLTQARLEEQLGRLGGTPFRLARLENRLEPGLILPVSELNRVRREAAARLEQLRAAPRRWTLLPDGARPARPARDESAVRAATASTPPELIVAIHHLGQLDAVLALPGIDTVYCEFENPKHYRDAMARFRADREARGPAGADRTLWAAPPRICKPGDTWMLQQVRSCAADGYLVRNFDHLAFFAGDRRRGDHSLNVANEWTADHFLRAGGLERVTASYDLNLQQLAALLSAGNPARLEITLHQHMPMFHMEHCVFCAFLSSGTDYTNCGRPCDRTNLRLRDHLGAEHPVKADAGCRNTVYNARAQTGAEFAARLLQFGARHFRIEFLDEDAAEIARLTQRYRQLLSGEIGGAELWREFKLINQLGVTRGTMDGPVRPLRASTSG